MTRRIFSHQNKTEITSTVTSDTDKVPSCAAVSTALAGKLDNDVKVDAINDDNKNDTNGLPTVNAVTTYVDSNIPGAMDFNVIKDTNDHENPTISVSNKTNGLCAVRVTKMSDGTTQYQSNIKLNRPVNKTTAFIFNITASEPYMIEAWIYNSSTEKLIPTAVKYA